MLKQVRSYEEACRTFRWRIPERYNLAFDVCDRQTMAGADGHRTALIVEAADGSVERYTFHVLRLLSNRLANVLAGKGIRVGDRVVVSFGPSAEAAVALLAVLKMGAVVVPVPMALGELPLAWRLADCGARAALVAGPMAPRLLAAREGAPALETLLVAGEAPAGTIEMWSAMETASDVFSPELTAADDPALLFYPCDAGGKPAGALHAQRALPGNLPPFELALGFFPQFGDIFWTSAEWMSFEGLLWALLPAWHHGVPVVAAPPGDADHQLALMGRHGVRACWLPPRDLALLAAMAATKPHAMPRALASGPEPLPAALHDQVMRVFGTAANEVWGTVECGAVAANNAALMELRPGSPGRASPGVTVEASDRDGLILRGGERGVLAVAPGAPGAFLGWWNGGQGGERRLANNWLATGRLGSRDLDGYLWPEALALPEGIVRIDGLAVALDEVEAALAWHSKVAGAGVVALDDGTLKAFVVVTAGIIPDIALARDLRDLVATRRATHEAPRLVEFIDHLPLDAEGRVARDQLLTRAVRLDAPSAEDRWV
jgi:acetyl-CoA synthetase